MGPHKTHGAVVPYDVQICNDATVNEFDNEAGSSHFAEL